LIFCLILNDLISTLVKNNTALIQEFSEPKQIAIITHVNPDGDAVGSGLALYHFFKKTNHQPFLITPNEMPEFLSWLPGGDMIKVFDDDSEGTGQMILNADIIINIDFNALNRIEKIKPYIMRSEAQRIVIDHHPIDSDYANYLIAKTEVSSTAELVYEFIHGFPITNKLDKSIAECIYTGIMTDTVDFKYNVHQRTFLILSDLMNYHIDIEKVHTNVYDKFSIERMQLMGYSLYKRLVVLSEYKTAYIYLSKEDQERFNFKTGDSEGFVNLPLSIKNIRFSALFMEKDDITKISFRSKGNFPVNLFSAKYFNGGGHTNAAGGKIELNLHDTIKKFQDLLPVFIDELMNT